jgi:hypothetical protein
VGLDFNSLNSGEILIQGKEEYIVYIGHSPDPQDECRMQETGSWDSSAVDCYGLACVHMATFSVSAVYTQIQQFVEMNEEI